MAFHFPLMPRLFMSIRTEGRFPVVEILQHTPPIPDSCQWALFLRNHDELTLEMVTDEERDYMYHVYAQDSQARINLGIRRRLAPLLGHSRRKAERMKALLLSLPGTPVLYYGDEIGMGDNIYLGDRNGVRTPFRVLQRQDSIRGIARLVLNRSIRAGRIRCRGDYHLGQVLYTGKDFVIIDFEGEPARPLGQRRIRHTPLRDVAGMMRSFHYAANAPLFAPGAGVFIENAHALEAWSRYWYAYSAATFMRAHLNSAGEAPFLPRSVEELGILLGVSMLEKVLYELRYELNNRPDWARIPLQGILQMVRATEL
jgi:hypothetical protein